MKRIALVIAAGLLLTGTAFAQENAGSMSDLLKQIEQGQARDSKEARDREARFATDRDAQQNLLNQARAERTRQERNSERLEQLFENQQAQIVTARDALNERLGSLKELFGVLQTVSGDAQGRFKTSLTDIQFKDRSDFLVALGSKMAGASSLASIEEIEQLWYELQNEIAESGKIVRFNHDVTTAGGDVVNTAVTRIGLFNIVSDGGYLEYNPNTGSIKELLKQPPQGRYTNSAIEMAGASAGSTVRFGFDGTRGSILGLLVESPTIEDRIHQGGIVGVAPV